MARIEVRLKREAQEAANARGHTLKRWTTFGTERKFYQTTCVRCGRYAHVVPHPMPNDIQISGTAVALNCSDKEENVT